MKKPSLLLLPLLIATPALAGGGTQPKIIYDPVRAGGLVRVEGVLNIRYVGDDRMTAQPEFLRTVWTTATPGGRVRPVLVAEERIPGQSEESWMREHGALVREVARRFPPIKLTEEIARSSRRPD